MSWPRWVRRLTLLLPPVAVVMWIVLACLLLIALVVRQFLKLLWLLWNAPPRRLRNGTNYYDYFPNDRKQPQYAWLNESVPVGTFEKTFAPDRDDEILAARRARVVTRAHAPLRSVR